MRSLVVASVLAVSATAAAQSPFETGLARFQANDFAGSIAPLERAHASDPRDADTTLLLGIAYYRTDQPRRARPLLEQVEHTGDDEGRASARVFLGLIADDHGDPARARTYFGMVARSSTELSASGRALLDRSGPERWSVVAILRPGYDSNVALDPATASPGSRAGDADLTLIGAVTARPASDVPFVIDETASYRRESRLTDYDALGDTIGGTYTFAGAADTASLAYHFEASTLGGARYELGHVADAAYRHQLGRVGLGAHYTFAARDYAQDAYAGYTGIAHTGVVEAALGSSATPHEVTAGYVIERDNTSDSMLAETGQGGRVTLRAHPSDGTDLRANVLALDRVYDEMGRRDVHIRGDAALYIDLSDELGFVIGTTLLRNRSSIADYDYTKWTIYGGLVIGTAR